MLLKEFLEPLGVSQAEAARLWDAQIWLRLQAKCDPWHAVKARRRRPNVARPMPGVAPDVIGAVITSVVVR